MTPDPAGKQAAMNRHSTLPKASITDTAAFLLDVVLPTAAKGPLLRRPRIESLAGRLNLDQRAVRRMQKLDRKYPEGPLLLRLPVRNQALILRPGHLHAVLTQSPDPFSSASSEKRGALAHFEPRNVLVSTGTERTARRALHEQALDSASPVHRFAGTLLPVVRDEADAMLSGAASKGTLDWDLFNTCWQRAVRRVVFGDAARDDTTLTGLLTKLRKDANWSALKPQRKGTREDFQRRVQELVDAAGPESLASVIKGRPEQDPTAAGDQVPQWLFALETSGMAAFRALALLSTHDNAALLAREEIDADSSGGKHLPFLRATVLESTRLWPTTPVILRQTTREVAWDTGTMPAKCGVMIFVPYFHRDGRRLPGADRFDPALWLRGDDQEDWGVVPFSAGPVSCPGRQLALLLTSALLSNLMKDTTFTVHGARGLSPDQPLPGTLNHFPLRFTPRAR
jgi:cytochrome P450